METIYLITVNSGAKSKTIQCDTQADLFTAIQEANNADMTYTVYEAKKVLSNAKEDKKG